QPVIYGSVAARLVCDAAVVNTISGLGYVFTSDHRAAKALRPLLKRLWRMALSHPRSRTIFQNPDDRADFTRMGLVHQDVSVVIRGSGVDCAAFLVAPEPAGVPVVVLPARMLWDKGVREFVEAAHLLRAAGREARFVLVGAPDTGNREAIPVERLDAWTREGPVEWWGHRRDMAAVLAGAAGPGGALAGRNRVRGVSGRPPDAGRLPPAVGRSVAGGRGAVSSRRPVPAGRARA